MPKAVCVVNGTPQFGTDSITERLKRDIRLLELIDQLSKKPADSDTAPAPGRRDSTGKD